MTSILRQWTRVSCSSDLVLRSVRNGWSTTLLGEDSWRRQSHVGRARVPPQYVPPGDLRKTSGLDHQVGRRGRQFTYIPSTQPASWAPELDEEGRPDPWRSRWSSHEITRAEWPWIFERSARVISTIEALAVLMGLKLFYGGEAQVASARNTDDPIVHRQPWQWVSTQQADDEQVPIKRGCHGTGMLPQTNGDQGSG